MIYFDGLICIPLLLKVLLFLYIAEEIDIPPFTGNPKKCFILLSQIILYTRAISIPPNQCHSHFSFFCRHCRTWSIREIEQRFRAPFQASRIIYGLVRDEVRSRLTAILLTPEKKKHVSFSGCGMPRISRFCLLPRRSISSTSFLNHGARVVFLSHSIFQVWHFKGFSENWFPSNFVHIRKTAWARTMGPKRTKQTRSNLVSSFLIFPVFLA